MDDVKTHAGALLETSGELESAVELLKCGAADEDNDLELSCN